MDAVTHSSPVGEPAKGDTAFLGHPKGLAYIVFAEAWERFSFYGMQALLMLYMVTYLFQPGAVEGVWGFETIRSGVEGVFGPLTIQALASQLFGLYVGFVYFMPVLGGWIGDKYFGRTRSVLLGGALMAVGHFLMAFEALLFPALGLIVMGSGFLKGNLAAQVGGLYKKDDRRRDSAFSLYVLSINVGAFVAPLACGTLGELYGWHYGFGVAGVGMLIGLIIYITGRHHLPPEQDRLDVENRPKLAPGDWKPITAISAMLAITALYWAAQSQVWNTYPIWIKTRVDRAVADWSVPVTWFQSLDSLAVLLLAPAVLWLWKRQSERKAEPADLTKLIIGCIIFAAAQVWLAVGETLSDGGQVALFWPVMFHFICAIGFLYIGPIALAVTSRAAPAAVNAMMVGSYYLAIFAGGIFSGWLGRFYEQMTPSNFWLMHGVVVGAGAVLLLLFKGVLARAMGIDQQKDQTS